MQRQNNTPARRALWSCGSEKSLVQPVSADAAHGNLPNTKSDVFSGLLLTEDGMLQLLQYLKSHGDVGDFSLAQATYDFAISVVTKPNINLDASIEDLKKRLESYRESSDSHHTEKLLQYCSQYLIAKMNGCSVIGKPYLGFFTEQCPFKKYLKGVLRHASAPSTPQGSPTKVV